ncbi:MAG TPA: addiction module protein [Burkholderiales bacterium]
MSDSDVAELLKLPAEEKLRLLELLWESLSASASALPLSDAHRAAIDEALAEHRQVPDDVLTMEQVLSGVRRTR